MARRLHVTVSQGFGGPGRSCIIAFTHFATPKHRDLLSVFAAAAGSWQLVLSFHWQGWDFWEQAVVRCCARLTPC
jgi:hypothetical protein